MLITLNVLVTELIIELFNNINIYVCISSAGGRGSATAVAASTARYGSLCRSKPLPSRPLPPRQ